MSATGEYPKAIVLTDGRHLELRALSAADALLAIGAFDGEQLVGQLRLVAVAPRAAEVGVVLDPAYHGVRLGTWLLLDAIHAAAHLDLEQLVADPPADADHAAALAHLDFVTRAGAPRLVKVLHRGWPRF